MRHRHRWQYPALWLRALSALQPARPHEWAARLPSQGAILSNSGRAGVQDVSERGLFPFSELCIPPVTDPMEHGPSQPAARAHIGVERAWCRWAPHQSDRAGVAAHEVLTALVDGHRSIACSMSSRQRERHPTACAGQEKLIRGTSSTAAAMQTRHARRHPCPQPQGWYLRPPPARGDRRADKAIQASVGPFPPWSQLSKPPFLSMCAPRVKGSGSGVAPRRQRARDCEPPASLVLS